MPIPHACWVILIGAVPTSFRAKMREDLLPTFKQLQRTQPKVALRWYERGRVWESPEAARAAVQLARTEARERRQPSVAADGSTVRPRPRPKRDPSRGNDWRPGGEHKDPKARYELTRDQKRAKFKRNMIEGGREGSEPEGSERPERRTRAVDDPFRSAGGGNDHKSGEHQKQRRSGPKDPFGRE
jgi:hypothetical protein